MNKSGLAKDLRPQVVPESAAPVFQFKRKDWLWALGLPIYILIGTTRHELSHAFATTLEGAHVESIHLLPTLTYNRGVLWGYVNWTGTTTWISLAVPYFCDVATFLIGVWIFRSRITMPHWIRVQVFVIGVVSPAINSLYNHQAVWHNPLADISRLITMIPPVWVGVWIILSLALYCVGIIALVRLHTHRSMKQLHQPRSVNKQHVLMGSNADGGSTA